MKATSHDDLFECLEANLERDWSYKSRRLNRSLVVLLYGLAMSLISINGIFAITYLYVGYSDNPAYIQSLKSA